METKIVLARMVALAFTLIGVPLMIGTKEMCTVLYLLENCSIV